MKIPRNTLSAADTAWLEATFARNRARFGDLRMEGDADADGDSGDGAADGDDGDSAADGPKMGPNGFPLATPWRQMKPEEQILYHQFQARKHERDLKAERSEKAALKAKADQFDALAEASKTDSDREIDRLKAENAALAKAQGEARDTFGKQLAEERLRAAAPGKGMKPEALLKLAGNPTRFLGDDGLDGEAIDDFLAALPDKAAESAGRGRADLGGGRRQSAQATGIAAGEELWASRHPKKTTPA